MGFPFPVICYKYFMHVQGPWKRELLTPTEDPIPEVPEKNSSKVKRLLCDFVISPCHCVTKRMSSSSSGMPLGRAVRYRTLLSQGESL